MTQSQRLVAMASGLAGKLFRIIRISCRGLVVMENSHQLNNLYITCTAHLSNKPSTMPDSNSSVRASLVWKCYPPTRNALELHTARANYQAKIWLQADQEHIDIPSPTDISAWMMESDCLKAVWTRLPPIPDACLELVTCGCKVKCRTARCGCFKTNLSCTYACGCDGVDCCNPAGQ